MANYGTKKYYEEQVRQAELHQQLLTEAVCARMQKNELKISDIQDVADILKEAQAGVENAKKDLEGHYGA